MPKPTRTRSFARYVRDKAKAGDLGAARMLLEYVEIRKQDEGRPSDQRLLELLSPDLRDAVVEELNGGELPAGWLHEKIA